MVACGRIYALPGPLTAELPQGPHTTIPTRLQPKLTSAHPTAPLSPYTSPLVPL